MIIHSDCIVMVNIYQVFANEMFQGSLCSFQNKKNVKEVSDDTVLVCLLKQIMYIFLKLFIPTNFV